HTRSKRDWSSDVCSSDLGEPPKEPAPAEEGEVIPAREVAAATTGEILGKTRGVSDKAADAKEFNGGADDGEESATENGAAKLEPEIKITGLPAPPRKPKKAKPITVASTPRIGNYELPPTDFLNYPDQNLRPTESKEELMANAR